MTDASALLGAARAGDDAAFARLVEPHRRELHAHCYRMLGSLHDADDALQDALLRSWRGLSRFEGRSSLRTWLYTITTNACIEAMRRRPKRVLPLDHGPAADPHAPFEPPVTEDVWLEPYPDAALAYEQREGVELAFVAALQHLPAAQRAVLILREVLGFSAAEVADTLDMTVAGVNSSLQRARAAVQQRVPDRSQQVLLQEIGDDAVRELVDRYVDAWERCDVEAFVSMLAEEVTVAMPPLPLWYSGVGAVREWAQASSMSGEWRWKGMPTSANGQPAIGFYTWDAAHEAYLPFALNVLTLAEGGAVRDIVAFIARSTEARHDEPYERFPDRPLDARRLHETFERFGLPAQLV